MRKVTILITLITLLILNATPVQPDGSGSEADPYLISSLENLEWIDADSLRWDSHYLQTADIDASGTMLLNSGAGLTGFGTETTPFTGTFDGDGYTIDSLCYDHPSSFGTGLFAHTYNAVLKNINISNADVTGNYSSGILAGYSEGTAISNCHISGTIYGENYVAGISAYSDTDTISNCSVDISITAISKAGGITAYCKSGSVIQCRVSGNVDGGDTLGGISGWGVDEHFYESVSSADITGTGSACGGFVGKIDLNSEINFSWSTGSVTSNYMPGGFLGQGFDSMIEACYSTGMVNNPTVAGGGFIAENNNLTIINSYWDTDTSGMMTSAGGIGRTTADMMLRSSYNNWFDADPIWFMFSDKNNGYPFQPFFIPVITEGSGTTDDPFLVDEAFELDIVRDWKNYNFIQTADIDLGISPWNEDKGWEPIGNGTEFFTGTYDGNGHTVSNLTINRPTEDYNALFGYSLGAEFKDIIMTGASVSGNDKNAVLLAYSDSTSVTGCSVSGNINGDFACGGLIGRSENSNISSCITDVSVTGTGKYTGGLVGRCHDSTTIESCSTYGTVTGTNNTGGLAGLIENSNITQCISSANVISDLNSGGLIGYCDNSEIIYSYSSGSVSAGSNSGGFIGYTLNSVVTHCYSTGSVDCPVSGGGLIGFEGSGNSFTDCFWDIDTSGETSSAGGIGKTTAQMHCMYSFNNWDWENMWMITPEINNGYPFLEREELFAYSGWGDSSHPYIVSDLTDLDMMRFYKTYSFILSTDIDASATTGWNDGAGFIPLGTDSLNFFGDLDGDRHTITGLYINNSTTPCGLFGVANSVTLSNINIVDAQVSGGDNTGILAGILYSTIVWGCNTSGTVTASGDQAGGLVGCNNGNIQMSSASCIVEGYTRTGGLAGQNSGFIDQCFSTGTVTSMGSLSGGLVGEYSEFGSITDSYSLSSVYGKNVSGGLIGIASSSSEDISIINCYSAGYVTGDLDVGGLLGYQAGPVNISNCFWDLESSRQTVSAGGTMKFTSEMQDLSTYANWDFATPVWNIDPDLNGGYPYLAWQTLYPLGIPQDITISGNEAELTISWTPVEEASSYKIFASYKPFSDFSDLTVFGTFDGTSWTIPYIGNKMFYYVIASTEENRKAPVENVTSEMIREYLEK